jgi:putative heme-binding domain-containing protein
VAVDPNKDSGFRADALKVLAWSDADGNFTLFQSMLDGQENTALRQQAIKSMQLTTRSETGEFLIAQWKNLTPAERDLAVNVFNTSPERQMQFLKAVESNQIQASTLGWGRTVRLLNSRNVQVREMARRVLEGNETISDSVWQEYQQVLTLDGNANQGAAEFQRSCASCHQISGNNGISFGPDLSAVRNRNKSGIMIDILKPNRSISDGYDLWTLEDKDGEVYSGIIVAENVNTLRLRNVAGEEVTIQQTDIASRSAAELSAMPEGLHRQISQQQMADLLEYLKN